MRICFFTDDITKIGGIERVTSILCSELCDDFDIDVVSIFKGREAPAYSFPDNVNIHYLTTKSHGTRPHSTERIINLVKSLKYVRDYFKRHDCDLIIAQSFPPAFAMFISGYDRKKIIACEHVYAWYYNKPLQLVRKYIYNRLRAVVVLTSKDKQYFESQGLRTEIIVIPNPAEFGSEAENLIRTPNRVIAAGRLEYQKGFDGLIRCFSKVHEKYPTWALDIYGKGSLRDELQSQIDALNLSENVKLKGVSNKLYEEFSKSQIYVLSSHFEGFPMVLIEALSCGLPCIAYDCPNGPSDIITKKNGILVVDQDEDALTAAVIELIENKDKLRIMQSNARSSVMRYEKTNIALIWKELINRLAVDER